MNTSMSAEEMQMNQQRKQAAEEQRISILDQILEPAAKDRLARLALTRKEKVRSVEDALISAAKNGKLPGKVAEAQLIQFLEQLSGGESEDGPGAGKKKIVIQRKKYGMEDEDDEDDSDLL